MAVSLRSQGQFDRLRDGRVTGLSIGPTDTNDSGVAHSLLWNELFGHGRHDPALTNWRFGRKIVAIGHLSISNLDVPE